MSSPLASAAGPIALVAGLVFAAVDVSRLLAADTSKERIAMMRDTPFQVTNALYFVVFIGLLLALVSVYLRFHADAGALGAVAFCFAVVGTIDMAGNMWFDGFAGPWITEVAPEAIHVGGSGMLAIGGFSSYVLFALGWMVFGVAGWRARMWRRWLVDHPQRAPRRGSGGGVMRLRSSPVPPATRPCAPPPRTRTGWSWRPTGRGRTRRVPARSPIGRSCRPRTLRSTRDRPS
jgi:hypothetical protein